MKIWLDAQLPPALAPWLQTTFGIEAVAVRDMGLRDSKDPEIFAAAGKADAVVMTKDRDFVELVERNGIPPQVLWVTCGNTTNAQLRKILTSVFAAALDLLLKGEKVVEISEAPPTQSDKNK
jgi:predicted nuclease of predicted toxin-antitoxin system